LILPVGLILGLVQSRSSGAGCSGGFGFAASRPFLKFPE